MVIRMNRVLKITIILIMFFTMFASANKVYATQGKGTDGSGGGGQTSSSSAGTQWSNKSTDWWKPKNVNIGQDELNDRVKTVVAAIRAIGIVVSVVALLLIGIRQITASAEEKSIIKEAMPGYILGLILVASITFLPTIIYNFMQNVN